MSCTHCYDSRVHIQSVSLIAFFNALVVVCFNAIVVACFNLTLDVQYLLFDAIVVVVRLIAPHWQCTLFC